ncbi:MAG TPA: DUF2071 domain-containing protein [Anaerolineae bacterium]|nr:DUF2071 domain-containing protein [Anaerolineae bacterium]
MPDLRKPARAFLTATWRYLAMLNYEIDPAVLQPHLPRGLEVDTWQDRAFVSMVGFMFLDTRLLGLPIPWHRNFEEVNLRYYVRQADRADAPRAVVFVKEIVPRPAIAWTARAVYGERYVHLPMRHQIGYAAGAPASVEYGWRFRGRWQRLGVRPQGSPQPMTPGSEEEFIAEHYWGYANQRGRTVEYAVEHPPWRVWQVDESWLECNVAGLYGPEFAPFLRSAPSSAFLAEGSTVTVRPGRRLS